MSGSQNHGVTPVRVIAKRLLLSGFLIALLVGCDFRQPDEYQFGPAITPDVAAELQGKAREGLAQSGEDLFRVVEMNTVEGFEFSMLDGFLYDRKLVVLHLRVALEFLRDYEVPTLADVEAGIGEPGWNLERLGHEYDRVRFLRQGRRAAKLTYGAGDRWEGPMTALFDVVGDARRLKHVGISFGFEGPKRRGQP